MWQRRAFLKAAGAGFLGSLMPGQLAALERSELVFASAMRTASGQYGAVLMGEDADVIATIALPDRGHDITFSNAAGRGVVFARQPGTFALVFDPSGREPPQTLTSIEGRHFFGHGVFSPDGRLLYATESDFEAAQGVIGIYDATDGYRRIGEFPSYGTGPHEMLLMPDGVTFVVANGGIETHPDFGRAELNLQTMDPSVVFMDGQIQLVELPAETLRDLRNYIGSVAASADGSTIAVSSPQGGLLVAIDAARKRPLLVETLRNGCGLAADGGGFVATSGTGEMIGIAGAKRARRQFDIQFDNHLTRFVR